MSQRSGADGNGNTNRTILPKEQIPDVVKKAVVATEDQTFYTNKGVDVKGIIRAGSPNLTLNPARSKRFFTCRAQVSCDFIYVYCLVPG